MTNFQTKESRKVWIPKEVCVSLDSKDEWSQSVQVLGKELLV